eukprot:1028525-Pyramimonas_sp.AAC.1
MPIQIILSMFCGFPCSLACASPHVSWDARVGGPCLQVGSAGRFTRAVKLQTDVAISQARDLQA